MGVLMRAKVSFKGQEGMVKSGDIFEVSRKGRAEDLESNRLAEFYEEEPQKDDGKDDGQDEQPHSLEEILKGLNSHAKVDEFADTNNLVIPGNKEAKLEERKAFINDLITNNKRY